MLLLYRRKRFMFVVVDQAMMTSMITDHVIKRLQARSTTALLTGWHADCTSA